MKEQKGFTLIELMVVMAIIAILATAGLSAYGGYLKKARDSTRIADLRAIESVVLASLGTNGSAPTLVQLKDGIKAMNNDVLLEDPLKGKSVCWDDIAAIASCVYWYSRCTNETGYIIGIAFEDKNKINMYTNDPLGDTLINDATLYEVGENCDVKDTTVGISGIIES